MKEISKMAFNWLSGGLVIGVMVFIYYYLRIKKVDCKNLEDIEAGETELDYIPIQEIRRKKAIKKKLIVRKTK